MSKTQKTAVKNMKRPLLNAALNYAAMAQKAREIGPQNLDPQEKLAITQDLLKAAIRYQREWSAGKIAKGSPPQVAQGPVRPAQTHIGSLIRAAKCFGYIYSKGEDTTQAAAHLARAAIRINQGDSQAGRAA